MRSDLAKFLLVPVAAVSVAGCGINSVPTAEEAAKAKWGDVQAAFQERANLIPNLAAVAKVPYRVGRESRAENRPQAC